MFPQETQTNVLIRTSSPQLGGSITWSERFGVQGCCPAHRPTGCKIPILWSEPHPINVLSYYFYCDPKVFVFDRRPPNVAHSFGKFLSRPGHPIRAPLTVSHEDEHSFRALNRSHLLQPFRNHLSLCPICTRLTVEHSPPAISSEAGKLAPALSLFSRGYSTISRMTSRASANSRLDLFSKHLVSKPLPELNTPFSTGRTEHLEDAQGNPIQRNKPQEIKKVEPEPPKKEERPKMSSNQAPHPALMIPGPIEFDDAVLQSMSYYR